MSAPAARKTTPSFPFARFALRDLRGGLVGLRVFLLCIALGVAAIVGVESLAKALQDGLGRQGRVILGGDASFSLIHRRLSPEEQALLERFGALSTIASMRAMARNASGEAALVEIKAVEPSWPSIGAAVFDPPAAPQRVLAERDGLFGAAAEDTLIARLDLKIGDVFRIGEASFVLNAALKSEPDRLAFGVGLGPRVVISMDALEATKLVAPGSLVRWTTRVIMGSREAPPPEGAVNALVAAANRAFPEAGWATRTRLNVAPDFARDVDRFAEFLTFAGLLSLMVGGVGVANAARGFIERKRLTLAILKAIGATGADAVTLALAEFLIAAACGAAAGAALGAAIPFAVAALFADLLPIPLAPSVAPAVILLGLAYGILAALAFAIPPLGHAHDTPVAALIRDLEEERERWPRLRYLAGSALASAALVALAVAVSPQRGIAIVTAAATLAAFVLLRLVALGLSFAARKAPRPRRVELSMAFDAIHRPGALTVSVVLSLGLGLTALVALTLIDFNLRAELSASAPGVTPSFFFLGVRGAEASRFLDFIRGEAPGGRFSEVPMMRGRFVRIAGKPVDKVKASDKVAWALEGDRGVTFAAQPPEGSEVVAGQWWPIDYHGPPLVSLEKEVADGLGLKVGDEVVVNVLGRDIAARIANLRKVNWRSYAINFVLVYSPHVFDGAPFSELVSAALPARDRPDEEVALLRAVARDFPAVASIRVRDVLDAVEALVGKLALAIRAATGVALLTSVLVLAGALAANRRSRLADATILKVLGATRMRLAAMLLIEYAILGLATAVLAIGAGGLTAFFVVTRIMETDFHFEGRAALAAAGGGLVLTIGLGMIGAWRILGQKPAVFLREL